MSFKFGITAAKNKPLSANIIKAPVAFGFDQDDDNEEVEQSEQSTKSGKKLHISPYGDLSSQKKYRKNQDKALEIDATIYDYDSAWDAIKANDEIQKAVEKEKAAEGKPMFMDNLLAARDIREKDYLRAKESKYQRERADEGDEFADKDKFVTGAYKKQQEELRLLGEAEKRKEEAEMKRENHGKKDFMNKLLQEENEKHQQAMEAVELGQKGELPILPQVVKGKSDTEIAKELIAKGAKIQFTDDGEVADKRDLLHAGLNIMSSTSMRRKPLSTTSTTTTTAITPKRPLTGRARQTQLMEDELLAKLQKRQASEVSEEVQKIQKTSTAAARERYLARRKNNGLVS